jgi:hypothetical protein
MLKYSISIIILFVLASTAFAEDKIYLNNDLVIDGSVILLDDKSVTFKYGDRDLIRTLHKDAIKVIIYADGTSESFPSTLVANVDQTGARREWLERKWNEADKEADKNLGALGGFGICIVVFLLFVI